jgi:WD40 repeat protein
MVWTRLLITSGLLVSGIGSFGTGEMDALAGGASGEEDAVGAWRGARMRLAAGEGDRHTIHSYFNTSPESPDGRWVLYYASTTPEGHMGEVCIRERATGRERVLARNVTTEDAHRAACQQWVSGGKRVAYHDVRDSRWVVAVVDLDTGRERVLARDRQLCWGRPDSDLAPLYGCHWNPGEHRDLEILNVATGEIRVTATAAGVRKAYPEWVGREFGDRPISIFFPVLSPDLKRVFFKIATPGGGDFRSKSASKREGLIVYDLERSRYLLLREKWGHPAWLPDSRTILEMGPVRINSETGAVEKIPGLPSFPGSHPSASPDGRLFVTDFNVKGADGNSGEWGVAVGDMRGERHEVIHRFDNTRGARSWRPSHPHPVFSPDGKRVYFNVSRDEWTRLYVAEAGEAARGKGS